MTTVGNTVNVNACWAFGRFPFAAMKVILNVPATLGVPDNTFPDSVIPVGSTPPQLTDGVGIPVVVTVNDPSCPWVNVIPAGEVIVGEQLHVWTASGFFWAEASGTKERIRK